VTIHFSLFIFVFYHNHHFHTAAILNSQLHGLEFNVYFSCLPCSLYIVTAHIIQINGNRTMSNYNTTMK